MQQVEGEHKVGVVRRVWEGGVDLKAVTETATREQEENKRYHKQKIGKEFKNIRTSERNLYDSSKNVCTFLDVSCDIFKQPRPLNALFLIEKVQI